MSGIVPVDTLDGAAPAEPVIEAASLQTLALHAEKAVVTKRVRRTLVKATRRTVTRDEAVSADLNHEHVLVERVAIGRIVDAVPPVRQEGDVTIMPVVEEELVVVRRLVLKEEVHLRRVRTSVPHVETVTLRQQVVSVTRTLHED